MMRATECLDEGLSFEDKIKMARGLYDIWGEELKRDLCIHELLRKLEGCLENSREVMLKLGIVETCKLCDEEEGGSCCGAGLENKFDTVLLRILQTFLRKFFSACCWFVRHWGSPPTASVLRQVPSSAL